MTCNSLKDFNGLEPGTSAGLEKTRPKAGRVSDELYKRLIVSESYEEFCLVLEANGYEFPVPTKKLYETCHKSPFSFFSLCLYPGTFPLTQIA